MILLNLKCDFCEVHIDGITTVEQVEKVMDKEGWDSVKGMDRCPKCRTRAIPEGKTNQHQQTFLRNTAQGKCWLRCEKCKHTYLCDSNLAKTKKCPRQDRHK